MSPSYDPEDKARLEREKKNKMREIAINTFMMMPVENSEQITSSELKTGDFICMKDAAHLVNKYYTVGAIKHNTNLSRCDEYGNPILKDTPTFLYESGTIYKLTPKEPQKTKLVGTEKILGFEISIFSNSSKEAPLVSCYPLFTYNKTNYYLVTSMGWGFVKKANIFAEDTNEDYLKDLLSGFLKSRKLFGKFNKIITGVGHRDGAKNARTMLKQTFPGTNFNVSMSTVAYGTLYVTYTDGPAESKVAELLDYFQMIDDGDMMTDYYHYKNSETSAIVGGFSSIQITRNLSKETIEQVDKVKTSFNLTDIMNNVNKMFGTKFTWPEDVVDRYDNDQLNYNKILYAVDLDAKARETKVHRQLTPTEKKIKEAIGAGNVIGKCDKDKYYVCQRKNDYLPVHYSQDSVAIRIVKRMNEAGIKTPELIETKWLKRFVGPSKIVVENYPELLAQIRKERKELKIADSYDEAEFCRLNQLLYKLSISNNHLKWETKNK